MTKFADLDTATRFRDLLRSVVKDVLRQERPPETYATVQTIDRVARTAVVRFPGETSDITLPMGALQPFYPGDVVRVRGLAGDRYIDQPTSALPFIPQATLYGTTAQRNAFVGMTAGQTWYDTVTKYLWVYDGTNWIVPYPLGRIATAQTIVNSAAFTSIIYPVTLSNISLLANRKIRVTCSATLYSATANANVELCACDAGGTIAAQTYRILSLGGAAESSFTEWVFNNTTATSTFGCRLGV